MHLISSETAVYAAEYGTAQASCKTLDWPVGSSQGKEGLGKEIGNFLGSARGLNLSCAVAVGVDERQITQQLFWLSGMKLVKLGT